MFGYQGYGSMTPEDIMALRQAMSNAHLRKAMHAGSAGPLVPGDDPFADGSPSHVGTPGGHALVPQSMEGTLASATFKSEDVVFWKDVAKKPVSATVSEFTRIDKHGDEEIDPWFPEGGSPQGVAGKYTRDFTAVRFIGVKGGVTFPMLHSKIVGPAANAEAEEIQRKTLHLLGRIEDALYFGDNKLHSQSWDGLRATMENQISTQGQPRVGRSDVVLSQCNIRDMRNQVLTGKNMREDMALQRDLHTIPNSVYMAHSARSILGNLGEPSIRRPAAPGQSMAGHRIGMTATGVEADHGYVPFKSTTFLKSKGVCNSSAVSSTDGTAPTIAAITGASNDEVAAGNDADGVAHVTQWLAADLGSYQYRYVGVSDHGVSAPQNVAAIDMTDTAKRLEFEINDSANDPTTAESGIRYYRVFRTAVNAGDVTTATFMRSVPAAAKDSKTKVLDFNDDIPGTTWTYSLEMKPDVVEFIRLLDYFKQDLAISSTTKEFLLILFGAFRSRTPSKLFAWKNCAASL